MKAAFPEKEKAAHQAGNTALPRLLFRESCVYLALTAALSLPPRLLVTVMFTGFASPLNLAW